MKTRLFGVICIVGLMLMVALTWLALRFFMTSTYFS